jgi:hypothetical protein
MGNRAKWSQSWVCVRIPRMFVQMQNPESHLQILWYMRQEAGPGNLNFDYVSQVILVKLNWDNLFGGNLFSPDLWYLVETEIWKSLL